MARPPQHRLFAKLAHTGIHMGIQNAPTCAPSADIGLWLTATIDITHTRPLLVRLFGGYVSAGNVPETGTTPAKSRQNAGDVPT